MWVVSAPENKPFNKYHGVKKANFYFFDCENDLEVARGSSTQWLPGREAHELNTVVGPKGHGPLGWLWVPGLGLSNGRR